MRFTMLFQFAVLRNVSCFAEHLSNVLNYFYLKSISNFGLFYLIIIPNYPQIIFDEDMSVIQGNWFHISEIEQLLELGEN